MGEMERGYRTRRSWLLAESICGGLALTIGLAPLMPGSRLAVRLEQSADLSMWCALFLGLGLAMIVTAAIESRLAFDHRRWKIVAGARELMHVGFVFCYLYALEVMWRGDGVLGLILLQSWLLLVVHVRGAWEHVKALHWSCRVERQPTVVEFARRRLGR